MMQHKGFVVETDHQYASLMKYKTAVAEVCGWLAKHGYSGSCRVMRHYNPMAGTVYGLYDEQRASHRKMREAMESAKGHERGN